MESRVEDWNTKRICDCSICRGAGKFGNHYDVRGVRYAGEGAARPLKTDFNKLTAQQLEVMQRENAYWKDKPWQDA